MGRVCTLRTTPDLGRLFILLRFNTGAAGVAKSHSAGLCHGFVCRELAQLAHHPRNADAGLPQNWKHHPFILGKTGLEDQCSINWIPFSRSDASENPYFSAMAISGG